MKRTCCALIIGLNIAVPSTGAFAQAQPAAMAEARARVACGSDTLASAVYLPGGLLQVTCVRASQQDSNPLRTTGLGDNTSAFAVVGVLVLLGVLSGGSSNGTTTTTNSGGGN